MWRACSWPSRRQMTLRTIWPGALAAPVQTRRQKRSVPYRPLVCADARQEEVQPQAIQQGRAVPIDSCLLLAAPKPSGSPRTLPRWAAYRIAHHKPEALTPVRLHRMRSAARQGMRGTTAVRRPACASATSACFASATTRRRSPTRLRAPRTPRGRLLMQQRVQPSMAPLPLYSPSISGERMPHCCHCSFTA